MKLTDKDFFINCIDANVQELKSLPKKAENNQIEECKRVFAAYVRKNVFPKKFYKCLNMYLTCTDEEVLPLAKKACEGYMTSCGRTYHFKNNLIDWKFNPTENNFKEWTFQLNRHAEWQLLARAYRITHDRKFYEGFLCQFNSWIEQAIVPDEGTICWDTLCWRTIEAGIRQGMIWGDVFHTFYLLMSDDVMTDWFKSVWEHANRLYKDHAPYGNWLLMEMNGLMNISVLYPWLKNTKEWFVFSEKTLLDSIRKQFFEDGFHYELSTDYHLVAFNNYLRPLRLCVAYGIDQSPEIKRCVQKMLKVFIMLMRPDGKTPSLNDGKFVDVKRMIISQVKDLDIFSEYCCWFSENNNPPFTSCALENSGIVVFRNGWNEDDTYALFDCGQRGAGDSHFHEDKLSVILYANGKEVLCEGNNYSYDSSQIRQYVLSTRSHNTVRVDGCDQNRRVNRNYFEPDLSEKSDFSYDFTDDMDYAKGIYNEGYGGNAAIKAMHERSIFFVKNSPARTPFLVVIDRLKSEQNHEFEINWHLDVDNLSSDQWNVYCEELQMFCKANANGEIDISHGRETPEWQGWTTNSTQQQGDYRPVFNAAYRVVGNHIKVTTVIFPKSKTGTFIKEIICDNDFNTDDCRITFDDGSFFDLSKK